jgi:hypothetical protein
MRKMAAPSSADLVRMVDALDVFLWESNVELMKQLVTRKNAIRSYDCSSLVKPPVLRLEY